MSCLRTLVLVLVVGFMKTVVSSPACCKNWNGDCTLVVNGSLCNKFETPYWHCTPKNGQCWGTGVCSDYTGNARRCSVLTDRLSGIKCFHDSTSCRLSTCADYTSAKDCSEVSWAADGNGNCKWNDVNCIPANSCADYNYSYCLGHEFNGIPCTQSVKLSHDCINRSCSGETGYPNNQISCDLRKYCAWTSSGTCVDFTSCDQEINEKKCNGASVNGATCVYNGACKVATFCSEFSTKALCRRYSSSLHCVWKGTSCEFAVCEDYAGNDEECEAAGCYSLKHCQEGEGEGDSYAYVVARMLMGFWIEKRQN